MTSPSLVEPEAAKRASFVLAVLLVLSLLGWFLYPDSVDHGFFKQMNGSLEGRAQVQSLVAFANTRVFDSMAGVILAAFFLLPGLAFHSGRRRYGILGFVPAALLFQPWRMFVGWLSGEKPSPGRIFWNDMVRLDEINAAAKVTSNHSFPSDHTAVLLVWATYLTVAGRSGLRWSAWLVVGALSLPRLLGGGHWLSDVLFGSPLVAIPPLLILFYFELPDKFLQAVLPRLPRRWLPNTSPRD